MHIFTSKKRPFIRISVLQSHMRSTYPRQVDSSQNRVAKDVLPTAPSPRRMTSQSMCKNGCWLDNHCLLLTQELKRLLQNWPYFSPKRWQQLFFEIPHGSTVKLQTSLGPSASPPFLCGGSRNSQGIPLCQPWTAHTRALHHHHLPQASGAQL